MLKCIHAHKHYTHVATQYPCSHKHTHIHIYANLSIDRTKKTVINEFCSLLGNPKSGQFSTLEQQAFKQAGIPLPQSPILYYPRLLFKRCNFGSRIICAFANSRAVKRNNSCIAYGEENYGIVQKIIVNRFSEASNLAVYLLVKCLTPVALKLCDDPVTNAQLNHIKVFVKYVKCGCVSIGMLMYLFTLYSSENYSIVKIGDVIDKCILMDLQQKIGYVFVSRFDNTTEIK